MGIKPSFRTFTGELSGLSPLCLNKPESTWQYLRDYPEIHNYRALPISKKENYKALNTCKAGEAIKR